MGSALNFPNLVQVPLTGKSEAGDLGLGSLHQASVMPGWPKSNTHSTQTEVPPQASTRRGDGSKANQDLEAWPSNVCSSTSEERNLQKRGPSWVKSTLFTKYLPFWVISGLICKGLGWMVFGVFSSSLVFCKPASLWDANPVTTASGCKTLFCCCGACPTRYLVWTCASVQTSSKNAFDDHCSVHRNFPLTENVFQKWFSIFLPLN